MPWVERTPVGRVNPDINKWRGWYQRTLASQWFRNWDLGKAPPTQDPWGNALRPEVQSLFPAAFTALAKYGQITGRKPVTLMRHIDRYANNDASLLALKDALLKYQRPFLDQPAMGDLASQAAPPIPITPPAQP